MGSGEGEEGFGRLALGRELDEGEAAVRAVELFGEPDHLELPKGTKELLDLLGVRLEGKVAYLYMGGAGCMH